MNRSTRHSQWKLGAAASVALAVLSYGALAAAATEDEEPAKKAAAAATATATPGNGDHDMFVGHLGIGWFGIGSVPLATGATAGTQSSPGLTLAGSTSIDVPTIGARYWLSPTMGLDIGVGFNMHSQSVSVTTGNPVGGLCAASSTCTKSAQPQTAFLLHGGLPLVVGSGKHIAVLVTPELNLGFAKSSYKHYADPNVTNATADTTPNDVDFSGFLLDVGARAGAEIHFGFMGIPELALEGSVGAAFHKTSVSATAGSLSASASDTVISTSNINSPWDFFRSNVAARYYF